MRKFNISIPVPTKDDLTAMATKAKGKVNGKIAQFIIEHGDDQAKAELSTMIANSGYGDYEISRRRPKVVSEHTVDANTQTKEV